MAVRPRRKCPHCGYSVRLVKAPSMAIIGYHGVWSGLAEKKPVRIPCTGSGLSVGWRA